MKGRLFGTDGIRGRANVEPITAETALKLGRALAHEISKFPRGTNRVLVGKDTRASGYMLEYAFASGICSMGTDVLLVGPMPTPGTAFLTTSMRCDAGAVISASHNPPDDNGIKFFCRQGFKLSDEMELAMERSVMLDCINGHRPLGAALGKITRIDDALGRYVVFTKNTFPKDMTLNGMKIVVDCANGAAYRAGPVVFDELGADVKPLAVQPNGLNINDKCGALYPRGICDAVRSTGADIGIAFDGDADRVVFCDERGEEVDGDQIMGLIAKDMISEQRLLQNTLVVTIMSNAGLDVSLSEIGGTVVRTPVGDRYVVEEMRRGGYNFGGEQSGHLIFLDHSTSGDGIIAALQILKVMTKTGKPLSELTSWVKKLPQVLQNVEVSRKIDFEEIPELRKLMQHGRERLKKNGRLLVRHSGTQPVCRVMAEGEDASEVASVVRILCEAIRKYA
ncbi:MAG: phosphoglucosamine mutase [Thermodesulfobacteriota bacterium]